MNRVAVVVETGSRRTFVSALDWPGWCHVARRITWHALDHAGEIEDRRA